MLQEEEDSVACQTAFDQDYLGVEKDNGQWENLSRCIPLEALGYLQRGLPQGGSEN